jgi:hypothetical protein
MASDSSTEQQVLRTTLALRVWQNASGCQFPGKPI